MNENEVAIAGGLPLDMYGSFIKPMSVVVNPVKDTKYVAEVVHSFNSVVRDVLDTEIPEPEPRYQTDGSMEEFTCSRCDTYYPRVVKQIRSVAYNALGMKYVKNHGFETKRYNPVFDRLTGGYVCTRCMKKILADAKQDDLYIKTKEVVNAEKKAELAEKLFNSYRDAMIELYRSTDNNTTKLLEKTNG